MAVNQDSIIHELKLRIRLLEKQNEQLAGRMEEKLLMWLVSDTIMESGDAGELLKTVLERISVLLDIPYSGCYQIHEDKFELIGGFALSETFTPERIKIQSPSKLIAKLEGSPLFLSKAQLNNTGVKLHEKLETETEHISLFPFESIYIPFGVFVFFETSKTRGNLKPVSMVIQHLVRTAIEKLEKLSLLQELKELNYSFESQLRERTENILTDQQAPTEKPEAREAPVKPLSTEVQQQSFNPDTRFMRNIGIEVRTPVNGILGFAELLRENDLDEHQKNNYIDIIKSCGKSMLKVIDDAVDYAFIKSDQLRLNPSEFPLTTFLTEIYDHFKVDELFRQRENLELKLNVNVNGNTKINADRDRLWQVMVNLVGNAVKFTKSGSIEIGCYVIQHENDPLQDSKLQFFVKDTGVGIPDEVGEKIFEPFYKIEYEISKLYGGMGLGLSIAKKLAGLMGGELSFRSVKGKGSEFYFTLPDALADLQRSGEKTTDEVSGSEFDWRDKKILIVEDDEMSYIYLREILKKTGAEVMYAKDGNKAVETVKQADPPDLVLMDIKLPGMSGYEATGIIKSIINVPVIVQTAYAMADDQRRILETGCDDYVTKPINRRKLLLAISRIFDKSEIESAD